MTTSTTSDPPVPYGSVLSILSKNNLRYEGVLAKFDVQASTVTLNSVRAFGTESRILEPGRVQIPPSSEVYESIEFASQDIQSLRVIWTPPVQQQGIAAISPPVPSPPPPPSSIATTTPPLQVQQQPNPPSKQLPLPTTTSTSRPPMRSVFDEPPARRDYVDPSTRVAAFGPPPPGMYGGGSGVSADVTFQSGPTPNRRTEPLRNTLSEDRDVDDLLRTVSNVAVSRNNNASSPGKSSHHQKEQMADFDFAAANARFNKDVAAATVVNEDMVKPVTRPTNVVSGVATDNFAMPPDTRPFNDRQTFGDLNVAASRRGGPPHVSTGNVATDTASFNRRSTSNNKDHKTFGQDWGVRSNRPPHAREGKNHGNGRGQPNGGGGGGAFQHPPPRINASTISDKKSLLRSAHVPNEAFDFVANNARFEKERAEAAAMEGNGSHNSNTSNSNRSGFFDTISREAPRVPPPPTSTSLGSNGGQHHHHRGDRRRRPQSGGNGKPAATTTTTTSSTLDS